MLGAAAKMVATFVTYPIQVIQSRLRVSNAISVWLAINKTTITYVSKVTTGI